MASVLPFFKESEVIAILEVGCGAGNAAFPLLDIDPRIKVTACDISQTAVDCVKENEKYNP